MYFIVRFCPRFFGEFEIWFTIWVSLKTEFGCIVNHVLKYCPECGKESKYDWGRSQEAPLSEPNSFADKNVVALFYCFSVQQVLARHSLCDFSFEKIDFCKIHRIDLEIDFEFYS